MKNLNICTINTFYKLFLPLVYILFVTQVYSQEESLNCNSVYVVTAKELNIRNSPSVQGEIVGKVFEKTNVCVSMIDNGWANIENGWVSEKYINKVENVAIESKKNNHEINILKNETKNISTPVIAFWFTILLLYLTYKLLTRPKCPNCKKRDYAVEKNIISQKDNNRSKKSNGSSGKRRVIFHEEWIETTTIYEYLYHCNLCGTEWKDTKTKVKKHSFNKWHT